MTKLWSKVLESPYNIKSTRLEMHYKSKSKLLGTHYTIMSKQLEMHYKIMSMIDKCQKTVHLDPPGNHTTSKIICKIIINKSDFG